MNMRPVTLVPPEGLLVIHHAFDDGPHWDSLDQLVPHRGQRRVIVDIHAQAWRDGTNDIGTLERNSKQVRDSHPPPWLGCINNMNNKQNYMTGLHCVHMETSSSYRQRDSSLNIQLDKRFCRCVQNLRTPASALNPDRHFHVG